MKKLLIWCFAKIIHTHLNLFTLSDYKYHCILVGAYLTEKDKMVHNCEVNVKSKMDNVSSFNIINSDTP